MKNNSHLEWKVKYEPDTRLARGYKRGQEILTAKVEATGDPAAVQLTPNRSTVNADGEDVSVVTVQVNAAQGRHQLADRHGALLDQRHRIASEEAQPVNERSFSGHQTRSASGPVPGFAKGPGTGCAWLRFLPK